MRSGTTCAIVPVKDLAESKQRLASALPLADRRLLVLSMLEDVLDVLGEVRGLSATMIVTADPQAGALAARRRAHVLWEARSSGLNLAVRLGLAEANALGFETALIIPGDVPLASDAEISRVLRSLDCPARDRVVIVPSRDGDGTNALLLPTASSFEPSFGAGSFVRHVSQAVAEKRDLEVLRLPGIGCDIDEAADLAELRIQRKHSPRYWFLRAIGGEASASSRPGVE